MEKYLIGNKQADGSYIYVATVDYNRISVTSLYEGAMDCLSKDNAINMCKYLNERDNDYTYTVLKLTLTVEEVVE